MLPTVYDISVKNVETIDITNTLNDAVNKMSKLNLRTIIVLNNEKFHILTTSLLIDLKLQNIASSIQLKELNLPVVRTIEKDLSILTILNQIDSTTEYMIILDDSNNLIGLVSYTDIINNVDPKILMQRQTVASLILNYKANFIYENSSTLQGIKLIKKNHADSIIVKDTNEKHVGIFTTKDFIDIMHIDTNLNEPIKKFMSSPLTTIPDDSTISYALDFIKMKHFKRLVIVDKEDNVVGIISQKELLRVVYNKWIELIKKEGTKISKYNEKLLKSKLELEELASLDFLTQIYNRHKFESFLEYEIKKHTRYEEDTFSLLMIDLDYFKEVNDTYGHLKGDYVLQEIAKILKLCSRETDIIARWGGEEFVMMLPHTDIDEALFVSEKLRSTIENHQFDNIPNITCSIGISQFHNHDTQSTFFKRADKALYKAKELGRNRVEIETLDKFKV